MASRSKPLTKADKLGYKIDLILDSGAYSAWTRGDSIDIKEYIKFAKACEEHVSAVVNLDTIPGVAGRKRTPEETEAAARKSYENLQVMKDAGVAAMPVFHQGENQQHLLKLLEDGEPYIGISPSGDQIKFNDDWLRECFDLCTNTKGEPIVKTHGFGVSSTRALMRYPWYSADSATWALKSGYGALLFPMVTSDRKSFNYQMQPSSVWITGQTRSTDRNDYQILGPHMQEVVKRFLEEECETTIETMMYHPHDRMRAMLVYFRELNEHLKSSLFRLRQYRPLKSEFEKKLEKRKGLKWEHKKIVIAVGSMLSKTRSHMLNRAGIKCRLVSYYEIRHLDPSVIKTYVEYGTLKGWDGDTPRMEYSLEEYKNFRKRILAARVKLLAAFKEEEDFLRSIHEKS